MQTKNCIVLFVFYANNPGCSLWARLRQGLRLLCILSKKSALKKKELTLMEKDV